MESPIKSAVVRFAVCFDPNYMASDQESTRGTFTFRLPPFLIALMPFVVP